MGYTPHVAVVGGGATGTGLARDLAMRGLDVTLVERGHLASGATGRTPGLLESGARYAETAPETARECARESRTLRRIARHCVAATGGLSVSLGSEGQDTIERLHATCEECGIEAAELSPGDARRLEPGLTEDVTGALEVPDGAVDPFRLTVANTKAAQNYGATIETHAEVVDLSVESGAVGGVELSRGDEAGTETIDADYVVNAAGANAGEIAAMADLEAPDVSARTAMVVLDGEPTSRVVRSCGPSVGGILVPSRGRTILATADRGSSTAVASEANQEVDRLFGECASLVPEIAESRAIRADVAVSPVSPDTSGRGGDTTGEFILVDHEQRDDTWGMSTVVGGRLTTYRLTAERIADHVCGKFGIDRACLTAEEPLPGSDGEAVVDDAQTDFGLESPVAEQSADRLGSGTDDAPSPTRPNPVLCDCEAVTRAEVQAVFEDETADPTDIDAIRVRTRAGMGECQGCRCSHVLAAELFPRHDMGTVDDALADFFQGRWAGQRHVLWGEQLAQAMETYAYHATTLSRDTDPADVDLAAFDSGPEWDESDVDPRGGGFRP